MSTLLDDVEIANFDYLSFNDKEFLGCGGEGDVYKAYSKELQRTVALKRYGRTFQENNLKEAKFLIKLSNSKNIVKMHGLLLDSSRSVGYVMEYMELGSLHDAIHSEGKFKKNRLIYGSNTILLWVHHAACGVKTLHDANIIHRDIKPHNILLGKNIHNVKISDFGLARDITASTLETLECGTKKYMAPEIIEDGRFKKAGDIFAFAITCWEMIERRVPHEDAISNKDLINSRLEFGSRGSIYVKLILQDLIEKGWSRNPNPRPSIEKFVEAAQQRISLMNNSQINCDILLPLVRLTVWAEEICRNSTGYNLSVPTEVLTQNGFYGQCLNNEFVDVVHEAMRNCQMKLDTMVYCAESISMKRIMDNTAGFGTKLDTATFIHDVGLTAAVIHKVAEECKKIVLYAHKKGELLEQWVATDLKKTTDELKNQESICNDKYAELDQHKSEINEYKSLVNHPSQNCTLETFKKRFELCEKLKQNNREVLLFVELLFSKIEDSNLVSSMMMSAYGLLGDSTETILRNSIVSENFIKNRQFLVNNISNKLKAAEKRAFLARYLARTANKKVGELNVREDSLRKNLSSIVNMNSELKNIQKLWEETKFEYVKISDADLYKLVYFELVDKKLATASQNFTSTNMKQMKSMPDVAERLLMAEKELETLINDFQESEKGRIT